MGILDLTDRTDRSDVFGAYAARLNHTDVAVVANTIICLIHQANYLLDQQIAGLERQFISEGGYSERLAASRLAERAKRNQANRSNPTDPSDSAQPRLPACPVCGKQMSLRKARQGKNAGTQFWGCAGYPECKGTRPLETLS